MANLKSMIEDELHELELGWKDVEAVIVCCLDKGKKDCLDHGVCPGVYSITVKEAKKLFDYEFDDDRGSYEGHRFHVYTRDYILFKETHDGAVWVGRIFVISISSPVSEFSSIMLSSCLYSTGLAFSLSSSKYLGRTLAYSFMISSLRNRTSALF